MQSYCFCKQASAQRTHSLALTPYASFTGLIAIVINVLSSIANLGGLTYLSNLGFGAINVRTLFTRWAVRNGGPAGLWQNTLIANAPQPILSLLSLL